jgi:hypothetical protein
MISSPFCLVWVVKQNVFFEQYLVVKEKCGDEEANNYTKSIVKIKLGRCFF